MSIIRKFIGPKSKYDKSLPYTYLAKVPVIEGDDALVNHYFADTICGLIDYLDANGILPSEAQLFGVYREEEIPLDTARCTGADGNWLRRPDICHSLESYFFLTKDIRYKGHVEEGECSFDDRDRKGSGPY